MDYHNEVKWEKEGNDCIKMAQAKLELKYVSIFIQY